MTSHTDDQELLQSFKDSATRERAFTGIIKKYQEKLYWHGWGPNKSFNRLHISVYTKAGREDCS